MIARAAAVVALAAACSSSPRSTSGPAKPDSKPAPTESKKPVSPDELAEASVAAIELRGLERIGESRAHLAIALETGGPFDRAKIRESLRQLMTIRGIADARAVAFRTDDGGVGVAFVVVESIPVESVTVSGNQALSDSELLSTAEVPVGAPLDPVAAQKGALAIRERYRALGHYRAEVDWKLDGGVVKMAVREGPRASIKTVKFPGARALSPERLKKILRETSPENTAGGVFVRSRIDDALAHITAAYYDIGHVDASVGPARMTAPEPETVAVTIPIDEGPKYRLGAVSVKGELDGPKRAYRRQLKLRRGAVFSRSEVSAAIKRLVAYHQKRTGSQPRVTPLTDVDKEKRRIDIAFEVE